MSEMSALIRRDRRDLPGGPVIKTLPSSAEGAKIPTCLTARKPKHKTEAIL